MTPKVYLILVVAFVGWAAAYPYNKKHYVVTMTGDEDHELLGSKMCTRGPAYWCHNITQAAECHAMHHCIQKVWENPKEKLPEDKDSVCQVCLDMVKQARDQLLSNETQDELRQVLEGSCNLIPLKLVSKECRELADDFIPELIDALTSRMDPQMVCHVSGLSNSVRIDEMLQEMKELDGPKTIKPLNPDNFDTCPECRHYFGEAVNSLKHLTKDGLKVRLLEVCGHLGSFSESCRMAVTHEMDAIYQYIQNNMQPKELCGLIGLCPVSNPSLHRVQLQGGQQGVSSMTNVRVWQPPKGNKDDLECDFCKQITESVRNWLVANNTQEEFQQVLEGLCKQTGKYKKECLNLADQYGKQIYDTLVEGLDPNEVCQSIGVCQNSLRRVQLEKDNAPIWTMIAMDNDRKSTPESSEEDDDSLPMMKLVPGERLTGDDEMRTSMMELVHGERLVGDDEMRSEMMELLPTERLAGDDEKQAIKNKECKFCEYFLHYLQNYLDDAKTEEEIREKVDKLCTDYLPEGFVEQCKTFVEEYGDALVTLIAQEVDPSEVCPKLRLCPTVNPPKPKLTAAGQPVKDILPTCALCTFTIEKVIHLVGKNHTKESIDAAMEGICEHIPQRMEDECMAFMKNYGEEVAEMILVYRTAHGVCAAVHLCLLSPAPTPPRKIIVDAQLPLDRYLLQTVTLDRVSQLDTIKDDSRKCVMCEFVITTLSQRLHDNATEEEIKQEVEHICTKLPQTVRGRCQTFVEMYGEEVIEYLSQEINPEIICSRLGLCQPQKKPTDAIRHLKMNRCELCMLISDYLSTLIEEEDSDQKIDELAGKTCAMVPKSYRDQCTALIEDYGPYLISVLQQETDKGKACAQIQLCPSLTGNEVEVPEDDTFEY